MAAPVVTGIAALILEYYPDLSARQLKYILTHTVMKLPDSRVKWPASGKMVDFNQLSVTGGIVNAYNALEMHNDEGERKSMICSTKLMPRLFNGIQFFRCWYRL
jgi:hypothetical protein